MNNYYYSDGLSQYGPFSLEELRGKKLDRNYRVRKDNEESWLLAKEVPELEGSLADGSVRRANPQPVHAERAGYERPPKTWLVESILVTIFCCLPFGIVGIVNAARVESKFNSGDYEGARKNSKDAGTWTKLGFWIGVGGILIYFLFILAALAVDSY